MMLYHLLLILSGIMIKNGQPYFINLAAKAPQVFGFFSPLFLEVLNTQC